jgi:TetR/AcrR family transcriptional regulator, mexCD-oprJ operon repressor
MRSSKMEGQATDRRKVTAERNVEAILDAAQDLLARTGQASVSAVAAQAGVSRVTVYAHFPTPEALLEAVVARAVGRTSAIMAVAQPGQGPPLAALDRLLAAGWSELDSYGAVASAALSQLSPAALTRTHQVAHEQVEVLIVRGQAEGSFRHDLPTGWLVASCFAIIHACAEQVRAGALDPGSALAVLTATVRSVVAAPDITGR